MAQKEPINVCVTGAAGQIAYSLLPLICRGNVFGEDQPVNLHLLDITPMMGTVNGVIMELSDCAFELVNKIVATDDPMVAFKDCDAAMLVGAMPRREGMLRKDLLEKNAGIFKVQGAALDKVAKKTVRVVVVGNPANTNALVTSEFAPSIPKSQFTALTHLDQSRARAMVAERAGVNTSQVKNVIIWGNHSSTQYPDVEHAVIVSADGARTSVKKAVGDEAWLHGDFIKAVQTRGAAVIKARKLSSAMSAAKAVADHMHVWWHGTKEGEFTSMGVMTDGSKYGINAGIVFSMPVTIKDGVISVVEGLEISDFSRDKMRATEHELQQERETALKIVQ
ncbi:cytosolic malate dehydrogenase [Salpingoeca rosetta]|uniref:malate dehydrogenase n=1 Tax=Salpingoeca rosetta (strain ATCC 50818 / BSB-021) TaxID=946362 RepID=F2U1E2_SALR5|nr:cytosolic malate dehydrogenase [Salpingoeca rosetta]EGD81444.1 cytosolic malate dehydrogenase [Salpingoeca rosetta]|eukprot:XP_004996648.1 cytosolic malate dehydrogenase [Salpingoeca rosetta]